MPAEDWLAEVSWTKDNVFMGTDTAGHTVVYDSSDGVAKGIGPMRALLTSLGACSGMDVLAILNKRKQRLRSMRIQLTGDRPKHGLPKPWTSIHIKFILSGEGLEEKYVDEAVRDGAGKFCSVGATLSPGVKITHSYVVEPWT
ncbi:MAG TPA: OsmC family protein [Nitrososphaerales archaeon]|nr:OsmC family protein [Nitrososphaerales archaeon]